MQYPSSLTLAQLESTHPEYQDLAPALQEISLLTAGGYRLKNQIQQFLPQRPGEESSLYESRLQKYTYNNILSSAINSQVSKLSNGALNVSGLDSEPDFWTKWREKTDLAGKRAEKELIAEIFREILKFKKVYLHIDKPEAPVKPKNKAQEKLLGLRPYLVFYNASQVINWSEDGAGKPQWIKVRQLSQDTSNPFAQPLTRCTWTYIDQETIARYAAYVKLDKAGKVAAIVDVQGEEIAGGEEVKVPLATPPISHNLGQIPVIKVELPSDLWVCDQAASKALQHLRTDCHKYDLETFLYVQRQWKPQLTPDQDLHNSYTDSADEPLPTGLQYVLQNGDFDWKEAEGKILPQLAASLQQIEDQVRSLISQGGLSGSSKGAVEQSGLSKAFDFQEQNEILKSYGVILTQAYQQVLQLVAQSQGLPHESISCSGLDSFDLDNLDSMLEQVSKLAATDLSSLKEKLPPTLFKLLYQKLCSLLVGNLSAEQQDAIEQEIVSFATDQTYV
ncbi:MAG TPA: hypothetical protein V6D10_17615 [Trichocoleus sp.]|jgi:hypothetical protein